MCIAPAADLFHATEPNMKIIAGGLALLLVCVAAGPAHAQQLPDARPEGVERQIEDIVQRSGILAALETLVTASSPELERTMEQVAGTLELLASRIAGDPELRASAARASRGLADVAEDVVVEQAVVLREALRTAADRIEDLSVPHSTHDPRR
jgi:hypothetical protein